MSAIIDANASLTVDEAIQKATNKLNNAMVKFDRWATQNPQSLIPTNVDFMLQKNEIKMMRLEINELKEMKRTYQNTLLMAARPDEADYVEDENFTKSRNTEVFEAKPTIKIGTRKGIKVSKG